MRECREKEVGLDLFSGVRTLEEGQNALEVVHQESATAAPFRDRCARAIMNIDSVLGI